MKNNEPNITHSIIQLFWLLWTNFCFGVLLAVLCQSNRDSRRNRGESKSTDNVSDRPVCWPTSKTYIDLVSPNRIALMDFCQSFHFQEMFVGPYKARAVLPFICKYWILSWTVCMFIGSLTLSLHCCCFVIANCVSEYEVHSAILEESPTKYYRTFLWANWPRGVMLPPWRVKSLLVMALPFFLPSGVAKCLPVPILKARIIDAHETGIFSPRTARLLCHHPG